MAVGSLRATARLEKAASSAHLVQIGDTAKEQVVFPACRVLDGECDNMIDAPQLVTTLRKGNRLGAVVKGFSESGKIRLAEALELFIAVDQARVGAVAGRCTKEFCHTSNKAIYRSVCVVEGEEV